MGWTGPLWASAGPYGSHLLKSYYAVKVYGPGHVIAHNAIAYFHDGIGISTYGTPEQDPELYRKLSPIYHVEKIRDPLLVLHGTSDVNVPFLESVRLIDALTKAGKAVELRMYPGEFHYFQRAHVLRDAWLAAERFFAEHLQTR